jgi:hypothetical protein
MPFGLANAPSIFTRMMDTVLGDLLYKSVFCFLDDIGTATYTFDEHLDIIEQIFQRLEAANLKLKLSKCSLFRTSIEFLGHKFTRTGVTPLNKNIEAVRSFATPTSPKDCRSYLGTVGYYRDHIPNFAILAYPLFQMIRKGVDFSRDWGESQISSFNQLKKELLNKPLLKYPDFTLPFIVASDTSKFATGASLSQEFPIPTLVEMVQREVPLLPATQALHEVSRYANDSIFHSSYIIPIQVEDHLYHSVDHYLLIQKATFFEVSSLSTRLRNLKPKTVHHCTWFQQELGELRILLEQELITLAHYTPESWEVVEAVEWYKVTLAKFYCQKAATRWLLKYSQTLKFRQMNPSELTSNRYLPDQVLRAVQLRLQTMQDSGTLEETRPLFKREPIAFYSSTLSPAECNYDTRERELIGIVRACEKFDPYIHGCVKLILENDHQSLTYLYNSDHTGRLFRWSWRLQKYAPFTALHAAGFIHVVPDGFSRYLESRYELKNLKDTMYGTEEKSQPPHVEILSVLHQRLGSTRKIIYDPIVAHPETPEMWTTLGHKVLDASQTNFYDDAQRLLLPSHDVVIVHGPYTELSEILQRLEKQSKPWAVLVPTLCMTHPLAGTCELNGTQVIMISAMKMFSKKNKRRIPLHQVWITKGLELEKDFEIVTLPDIEVTDTDCIPLEIDIGRIPSAEERTLLSTLRTRTTLRPPTIDSPSTEKKNVKMLLVRTRRVKKNYSKKAPVQYEVEKLVQHRFNKQNKVEFLVAWKNYPESENSWVPESQVDLHTRKKYWKILKKVEQDHLSTSPPVPTTSYPPVPEILHRKNYDVQIEEDLRAEIQTLRAVIRELRTTKKTHALSESEDRLLLLEAKFRQLGYDLEPTLTPQEVPLISADDVVPPLAQFRTAQLQDPLLRKYLLQEEDLQTDPAGNDAEIPHYYLVCRRKFPDQSRKKRNQILLLKQVPGRTFPTAFPTHGLSETAYGLPTVTSPSEAALLFNTLSVTAMNESSIPLDKNRFKKRWVQFGKTRLNFLELQITADEAADLTAMEACAYTWTATSQPETALSHRVISVEASAFICALRDASIQRARKEFPDNLLIKDGILYYVDPVTGKGRLVVPPSLRLKLMFIGHDSPLAGHRGATKTYQALKERYWWGGMRKEIYHYCGGCLKCHQAKATLKTKLKYLSYYVDCEPGHTLHIDHFGPFCPSPRGNTVVLTVMDRATQCVWTYACIDATAETVAETLYFEHFLTHGLASVIVSDNGPAFRGKLLFQLNSRARIKHLFTTPYNPASNGKVERVHRTLRVILKIYVDPTKLDWDKDIKVAAFAIRTTVIEGQVYTPHYLYHGREANTPLRLLSEESQSPLLDLPMDYVQAQAEVAKIIKDLGLRRQQKYAALNQVRENPPVWEEGQLVLVRREVMTSEVSQKFIFQWVGPFCVMKRVSPSNYLLDLGNGKSQTYHVKRLHAFHPTSHPRTSSHTLIDLCDISTDLIESDAQPPVPLPTLSPKVGDTVLALVDEELRLGHVLNLIPETDKLEIHLLDTSTLGATTEDPDRWDQAWFPLYRTLDQGLVIKKPADVQDSLPVTDTIRTGDILDVPFLLPHSRKLNLSQRRVIRNWFASSDLEE